MGTGGFLEVSGVKVRDIRKNVAQDGWSMKVSGVSVRDIRKNQPAMWANGRLLVVCCLLLVACCLLLAACRLVFAVFVSHFGASRPDFDECSTLWSFKA